MAFANGGRIVTDGLVLSLDAGDRNSYPGTGTTWFDLSGNNNNATLGSSIQMSSLYGGGLVFSNSTTTPNMTITGNVSFSYTAWTYEIIFVMTNIPSNDPTGIFGITDGSVTSNGFRSAGSYAQFSAGGAWVSAQINNISGFTLAHRIITKNSTSLAQYNNGILYNTGIIGSGTGTITSYSINCNGCLSANNSGDGTVFLLRIYNRELLSNEITQNYNSLKSRFGL
jgi:hypothetical protein